MAHPKELRMRLRTAYLGGLPLESAAEKVGVPYPTARNWFRAAREEGDDWDKFRAASLIVAGGGIEQALGRVIAAGLMRCEALLESIEGAEDPFEAVRAMGALGDTVSKLRAASKGMMPEADRLGVAMDVIRRFGEFTAKRKPALAGEFVELIEAFGEELAKAYG